MEAENLGAGDICFIFLFKRFEALTHYAFPLFDEFSVSPTERFYNFMSSYYFLAALLLVLIVLEIVTSIVLPPSPGQIVVIVLLAISIAGIAVYLSTFHLNACEG